MKITNINSLLPPPKLGGVRGGNKSINTNIKPRVLKTATSSALTPNPSPDRRGELNQKSSNKNHFPKFPLSSRERAGVRAI
jgi:hypothetical protein